MYHIIQLCIFETEKYANVALSNLKFVELMTNTTTALFPVFVLVLSIDSWA